MIFKHFKTGAIEIVDDEFFKEAQKKWKHDSYLNEWKTKMCIESAVKKHVLKIRWYSCPAESCEKCIYD